jgi:hypothetical protein
MSTKTKWFKGPPPSLGWWPASYSRNKKSIRWWNGSYWSLASVKGQSLDTVSYRAHIPASASLSIEWTHRPKNWPKRSMT